MPSNVIDGAFHDGIVHSMQPTSITLTSKHVPIQEADPGMVRE
jgi:hypothetical protein